MKGFYQHHGVWYPEYPDLGVKVAKLRNAHPYDSQAHGEAVLEAMRAKHRTLHMRPTPSLKPNWYSPPSITRLLRHEVPPHGLFGEPEWRRVHNATDWGRRCEALYAQAMKEKHARP